MHRITIVALVAVACVWLSACGRTYSPRLGTEGIQDPLILGLGGQIGLSQGPAEADVGQGEPAHAGRRAGEPQDG